jgi:IclR family mhp operon transcriptional activator
MQTSSVQSLQRGLAVLECVNRRNGAGINEIAAMVGLARGTTYRILETLRREGFLVKPESRGPYWLSSRVGALSDGYRAEAWVQAVTPMVEELSRRFLWPITVATPDGIEMNLRVTTDYMSPLAKRRFSAGYRHPLWEMSTGRIYLAYCTPEQQETLIGLIAASVGAKSRVVGMDGRGLARLVQSVRKVGYAFYEHESKVTQLAVPIFVRKQVFGAMSIRYFTSVVTRSQAIEKYLAPLRKLAADIGTTAENTLR